MFSNAYAIVKNFTRPVIVTTRFADGSVESGCATFIVVNADGWIVTAAHVLNSMHALKKHTEEKAAFEAAVASVKSDATLSVKNRNKRLNQIRANPKWITHQSFWWSQDGVVAKQCYIDPHADIAVIKLDGLDVSGVVNFPVFRLPGDDPPLGGSLCRLGFPFATVKSTFDEVSNQFKLEPGNVAMFPNDGIHTRIIIHVHPDTKRTAKFIETSTPGLRGQSGGPLFDTSGSIWGIQSHTDHLELGFTPKILKDKTLVEVKEHQFMHVGRCAHLQHVIYLFEQHNVRYDSV